MEKTNATRLRYKGSALPSRERKRRRSHSPSSPGPSHDAQDKHSRHHHGSNHSRHSRSETSKSKRRSRSRSRSPKRRRHHDRHRSKKRHDSLSPEIFDERRDDTKYKYERPEYPRSFVVDEDEEEDEEYFESLADLDEVRRNLDYLERKEKEVEEQHRKEQENNDWTNRLFEEYANDYPTAHHSDWFSTQNNYHGAHQGSSGSSSNSHINSLSDAEYTAYLRQGMDRSREDKMNKEWKDWVREQEKIRYAKAKEEQKKEDERRRQRRREKKEREQAETGLPGHLFMDNISSDTPATKLRRKAMVEKARSEYEHGWKELIENNSSNRDFSNNSINSYVGSSSSGRNKGNDLGDNVAQQYLSLKDIPLPPLNNTREMLSNGITENRSSLSLFEFLFHGTTSDQVEERRQLLRREQLRFHPDKFKQRFGTRLPPEKSSSSSSNSSDIDEGNGGRGQILEMVDRVARALNEMSETLRK